MPVRFGAAAAGSADRERRRQRSRPACRKATTGCSPQATPTRISTSTCECVRSLSWADKNNVPAMTRMVQNPTMPRRWTTQKTALVMDALAKLHDERAYPALAEKLAEQMNGTK